MRAHRVGDLGIVVELVDRADDLGRDLLVELHVVLELGHDRARQRLGFDLVADRVRQLLRMGLVVALVAGVAKDLGAADALDQHLHCAVRELEELEDRGERADIVDGLGCRLVLARVLLGGEQDLLVRTHHLFERADRLLAADEKRHDHMRENHDVAERQDREVPVAVGQSNLFGLFGHFRLFLSSPAPFGRPG